MALTEEKMIKTLKEEFHYQPSGNVIVDFDTLKKSFVAYSLCCKKWFNLNKKGRASEDKKFYAGAATKKYKFLSNCFGWTIEDFQ